MKNLRYDLETCIVKCILTNVSDNTWYNVPDITWHKVSDNLFYNISPRKKIWNDIRENVEDNILQSFSPIHQVLHKTSIIK